MRLLVGIDMSSSSPGLALQWEGEPSIRLWGVAQRQRDVVRHEVPVGSWTLSLLGLLDDSASRWARHDRVVTAMLDWIQGHAQTRPDTTVHCFIEGYALGMMGSSSVSMLCELGGILRHALWRKGWSFEELAPTTVKKYFAGSGKADKAAMAQAYEARGYPPLAPLLNCQPHQHPLEDMIDAVAVLYTGQQDRSAKTKGTKRKAEPKLRK